MQPLIPLSPVNIGNPIEHSILDFARIIKGEVGGKSSVVHHEAVQDDPQRRRPDIRIAKMHLGWEPRKDRRVFRINSGASS